MLGIENPQQCTQRSAAFFSLLQQDTMKVPLAAKIRANNRRKHAGLTTGGVQL